MTASRPWGNVADQQVTCIASVETFDREDAHEYDKHGDRWNCDRRSSNPSLSTVTANAVNRTATASSRRL
ncbi:DUF7562 family protein [Halorhabdus amylolytica]